MPLVFIHGVNNRDTDRDYHQSREARRKMFEELVVPTVMNKGFADFAVADDIYWGDLGVGFLWNLRSVPATSLKDSLGTEGMTDIANTDLFALLAEAQAPLTAAKPRVERLGDDQESDLIAAVAAKNPATLIRAIFAPDAERFAPAATKHQEIALSENDKVKAAKQGEHLALLLMAAEQLAREVETRGELVQAGSDREVLKKIQDEVEERYRKLVFPPKQNDTPSVDHLGGGIGDAIDWTRNHLQKLVDGAKSLGNEAKQQAGRAASLLAFGRLRQETSRRGLRFFGDVLTYLHHGRNANPSIYERVRSGILALQRKTDNAGKPEPLIVVTHSFGSEIFYDLLTSGDLDNIEVDLWVTVGAQTSLFAEMRLFESLPATIPTDTKDYFLGKPKNVVKWINVYDAADALSFLHEPVFGPDAVKDIQVREGANLTNAHGHYFLTPFFYEEIARAVEEVLGNHE